MDSRVCRLGYYEEAIGVLNDLREEDGCILASIGPVFVVLPCELGVKIRSHIGSRIGILRTERDYRFKVFSVIKSSDASKGKFIGAIGCVR